MRVAGVVAEFNPFHNGHKYLLDKARDSSDAVVCVMSGSFVQRGEPAVFTKHLRAKAALENGADLVVELPCVWSAARAEDFAKGAIFLLKNCGVSTLVFGSECGDVSALENILKAQKNPEFDNLVKTELKKGKTFAAAREAALEKICDKSAAVVKNPNDILGVQYLSAAEKLGADFEVMPIKRKSVQHDDVSTQGGFASASYLRENLDASAMENFVPFSAAKLYNEMKKRGEVLDFSRFETTAAALLRFADKTVFSTLPDISEGIENSLIKAAESASSFSAAAMAVKSKRYTLARIKRLLVSAILGIDAETQRALPPYIKVLGATEKGTKILSEISKNSTLPIIARPADTAGLEPFAQRVLRIEARATELQGFCMKTPLDFEQEKREKFIKK